MAILMKDKFEALEKEMQARFDQLKANEEELNKIFIELYGLEDELDYRVEDKDISVSRANRVRETKSFLSYFIGCLMGRYSLDQEGLAYAGGEWNPDLYHSFTPTADGIVTFTDEGVLNDEVDTYTRLKEFLTVVYGGETLQENLLWIAEGLGKKAIESAESAIRGYFLKDFFKDHLKTYKNRPIYWMIDSGKANGMKSLVYLHRYAPHTLGLALNNHLKF